MSGFSGYTRTQTEVPYFSDVTVLPPQRKDSQTNVRRLFVDNRDRPNYPTSSPFSFRMNLENVGISPYENVTSVELKAIAFPKVDGERYVIVSIDELNDNMLDATNTAAQNAFAVVYFDSDVLAAGAVKPLKGVDFYQKQLFFRPPLARLNTLTIKFLDHSGALITSSATGGQTQVSMLFEITTKINR